MGELATFGFDVAPSMPSQVEPGLPPRYRRVMPGTNWVLTRLHVRYTKDSLGEDLVFREAPPLMGGREIRDEEGKLEHGAQPSQFDNFQARYAIRHPWTGPIDCKAPKRGVWGGPPAGASQTPPKAAQRLGFAAHLASAELASFVKQDVPEIGYVAKKGGCLGCAVARRGDASSAGALGTTLLTVLAAWQRRRRRAA
jgi:hypothetical protein